MQRGFRQSLSAWLVAVGLLFLAAALLSWLGSGIGLAGTPHCPRKPTSSGQVNHLYPTSVWPRI
jgi:hypothetical protein